jgi:hypothetical protein
VELVALVLVVDGDGEDGRVGEQVAVRHHLGYKKKLPGTWKKYLFYLAI